MSFLGKLFCSSCSSDEPGLLHCYDNDPHSEYTDYYSRVTLTPQQISEAMIKGNMLHVLYKYQKLEPSQIDVAMNGWHYDYLYVFQELTSRQIDKAIERGKFLRDLYRHQVLSSEQIDRAAELGKELDVLYLRQKLTPRQIDEAIERGKRLDVLYLDQRLTPEQKLRLTSKARFNVKTIQRVSPDVSDVTLPNRLEKDASETDRRSFYKHRRLTLSEIDEAMELGEDLDVLYKHQKLSPYQVNIAIKKGKHLDVLYSNQELSQAQKFRLAKKLPHFSVKFLNSTKELEKALAVKKPVETRTGKSAKTRTTLLSTIFGRPRYFVHTTPPVHEL